MRAAMRCTAPINAPGPPPTMPRRSRRSLPCFLDSAGMFGLLSCRKPQHSPVGFLVRTGFCKIVERALDDFAKSDRKSTRLNSSHGYISYAVFCLKKKKIKSLHADTGQRETAA